MGDYEALVHSLTSLVNQDIGIHRNRLFRSQSHNAEFVFMILSREKLTA